MWWKLEEAIDAAAREKISGFERNRKRILDENSRRTRRSAASPELLRARWPDLWIQNPSFNPYHVRARAEKIGYSIAKALKEGRYAPRPPIGLSVPKSGGGERVVSSFAIADEVVSRRLYQSLLKKNRSLLSARSYAYRDDIGVYDAVAHIMSEWRSAQRLFVAEYDFTAYFDSISHDHIRRTIQEIGLAITLLERQILERFLTAPIPVGGGEKATTGVPTARSAGVPQGTSVSLLLANLAATPLDRALDRLGVGFVRYADDTLIWSREYTAICRAVESIHELSAATGVVINEEKSAGIRLLVGDSTARAEMPFTSSVSYLSHELGLRSVGIREKVLESIRAHIGSLVFDNLLREPLGGSQNLGRLGVLDRDYIALIWQLRRYLYGSLTENEVRRLRKGPLPPISLEGVVSRFPYVDDEDSLRSLDAWLSSQVWMALRKRARLLQSTGLQPEPWGLSRTELIRFQTHSSRTGARIDARLPSALRMLRVVSRSVKTHGIGVLGHGSRLYEPGG